MQAILPEKHMIDDYAHAYSGSEVNNYFSFVCGRIPFTGSQNICDYGYKGLMGMSLFKMTKYRMHRASHDRKCIPTWSLSTQTYKLIKLNE